MSLELVMIVKNSGYVLKQVLENIKNYIDYWTILDTGSTDGTQDLIRETLSGVKGKLWEEPFVNFRDTRNRSLELSSKQCKWTIILDDSYQVCKPASLKRFLSLKTTNLDTYQIKIVDNLQGFTYNSIRIIKTASNKRYEKYKIHESIIDSKSGQIPEEISYIVDVTSVQHLSRSKNRYERDITTLLEEDQNDLRVIYYLARTYNTMGNKEEALKYYNKVVELDKKGRSNEKFEALMMINDYKYNKNNSTSDYKKDYGNIFVQYPFRVESLFEIFSKEYKKGDIKSAYSFIKLCMKVKEPQSYPYEYNFNLYRFTIPYFYIDLSLKMGQINQAVECLKSVLKNYPDKQEFLNIKYNITDHPKNHTDLTPDGKTVVIHTGKDILSNPWNKDNIHKLGSGSEIMAIKLAESFVNYGYRAFLIGHFKDDKIDYQTIREGVQYIDYSYFNEFVEKYNIDILIVSRFLDNLLYYDNIKNVFLWVHDVYPNGNDFLLQTHPGKFRNFLCMSNWHIKINRENFNLPEKLFSNFGNGIELERFSVNKSIKKIPHRYIWTSCVLRGLNYAIDMFSNIKKRYPEAEFHIYGRVEHIDTNNIDSKSIFVHNRVDQKTLTIELLKSDVWLYPNNFEETYCISAVEAQATGCLVCCNVHAGLQDTVADRGAIIKGKYDKEKLLEELFRIQEDPSLKNKIIERGHNYAITQDIKNLVPKIINLLE